VKFRFAVGDEVITKVDLPTEDRGTCPAGERGKIQAQQPLGGTPAYVVRVMNLQGFDKLAFAFEYMLKSA
jgi:hypothetical protein